MGVTVSDDFCGACHGNIGKERASHQNLSLQTCGTGGCHNYHDNQALYEDFLAKHLEERDTFEAGSVAIRNFAEIYRKRALKPVKPLAIPEQDAPLNSKVDSKLLAGWESTGHAHAGVNCRDCHEIKGKEGGAALWKDQPDREKCKECHSHEVKGFLEGKHGMRTAQGLPPMNPKMARLAMKSDAPEEGLRCTACHGAHRFDTRAAAAEACLACHDDTHSQAYKASPHYRLWVEETAGLRPPGTGVSCATCHLPREVHQEEGKRRIRVQHNQNFTLRPNEKMLRGVCMNCHGLGFSIDALADLKLIERNFKGRPSIHIKSLEMVGKRIHRS